MIVRDCERLEEFERGERGREEGEVVMVEVEGFQLLELTERVRELT